MTIEIANRLANLRKEHGYSQEDLAEKLNISRQAVSKWERAESAPDLDNLMQLSELYGVSLDDLLKGASKEEVPEAEETTQEPEEDADNTYVDIGASGIHVENGKEKVHIGWNGIHIEDAKDCIHIGKDVVINGASVRKKDLVRKLCSTSAVSMVILLVYLCLGFSGMGWHPWWALFFLVPVPESLYNAIRHRKVGRFLFPCVVLTAFVLVGSFLGLWWQAALVGCLLIGLFYIIC